MGSHRVIMVALSTRLWLAVPYTTALDATRSTRCVTAPVFHSEHVFNSQYVQWSTCSPKKNTSQRQQLSKFLVCKSIRNTRKYSQQDPYVFSLSRCQTVLFSVQNNTVPRHSFVQEKHQANKSSLNRIASAIPRLVSSISTEA